jgi:hypothetical protein
MYWTVRGVVSLGGRRFNFFTKSIGHPWSLIILWALLSVNGMHFTFYADTGINFLELLINKFVLRMTLSEALCDDLAAIKACIVRPLPRLDAFGR